MHAAWKRQTGVVRALLVANATNVNLQDFADWTALMGCNWRSHRGCDSSSSKG